MFVTSDSSYIDVSSDTKNTRKVPTLFTPINQTLQGGLMSGEVGMILAESGSGKSTVINCSALSNSIKFKDGGENLWSYVFLLEGYSKERMIRIIQSYLHETKSEVLNRGKVEVPPANLILVDETDLSANSILGIDNFIHRWKDSYPPGVIYVDYPANMDSLIMGDHLELKAAVKQMERMAIHHECPVWFGNQAVKDMNFSYDEGDLLAEKNVAGAKAMINSCALCLSINRSREQFQACQATINVFKCTRGPKQDFQVYCNFSKHSVRDL